MASPARKPTLKRVRNWEPRATLAPRPVTRIVYEEDDADLEPTKRVMMPPHDLEAEAAPVYQSGIQDLIERRPERQDSITEVSGLSLSSLVAAYEERVEQRREWLNAQLTPVVVPERPVRHVLGPRPLRVILETWFAFAMPFIQKLASEANDVAQRAVRRAATMDAKLVHRIGVIVLVAAISSMMTLLATRL